MDSENTAKFFYVVEFPDEKDDGTTPMSIISNTWISQRDDEHYCVWPNMATDLQRHQMIVKHKVPVNNTSLNRATIIYKSNTYEKAARKMKELEERASVSQSETETCQQKRSVKKKTYSDYNVDTSSDSDGSDVPIIQPKKKIVNPLSGRNKEKKSCSEILDAQNPVSSINSLSGRNRDKRDISETPGSKMQTPTSNSFRELLDSRANSGTTCTGCKKSEAMFTKIMEKINDLRDELRTHNRTSEEVPNLNHDILQFLPATSDQQLENFNSDLMGENMMPQVCLALSSIGGRDAVDTTRRLMQKIITNQLALTYNWSGRNGKPAFCSLKNVVTLIIGIVRKNRMCKEATQAQIEDVIKTWLRNAPDREGGRNKRRRNV